MHGHPFKYFAYGAAATEVEVDGFTGAYRTRRVDIVHDVGDSLSPLVDLGQIEGGFVQGAGWLTLEDLRWDESDGPNRGRLTTQAASTYKLPSFSEMPEEFNVALLQRAHEDGAVYGSKAVGEPPLMLAFSVREALRQAAAAFGPPGTSVDLAVAGHPRGGLLGDRAGPARPASTATSPRACPAPYPTSRTPTPSRCTHGRSRWPGRRCRDALARRGRTPPPASAPRASWSPSPPCAGMPRATPAPRWSSPPTASGGASAAATSRRRPSHGPATCSPGRPGAPESMTMSLNDKARTEHGRQCCGGEVTLLLEPLAVVPSVAIFGVGHVGLELARILSRHDLELHLVDSRADQLTAERLACLDDGQAAVHVHHSPLPEVVLGQVPRGTHVLVMTHDHAEDFALCDAALRCAHLGIDRADRVVGEVAPFPAGPGRRGSRRGDDRPDPLADRRSRPRAARTPPRSRSASPPSWCASFQTDHAGQRR